MYDAIFAEIGINSGQYMILATISASKELSVHELARAMAMDRTTMGKNIKPMVRDGLVRVTASKTDRRRRHIELTTKGLALLDRAIPLWKKAHSLFRDRHGAAFSKRLRGMLDEVSHSDTDPYASAGGW